MLARGGDYVIAVDKISLNNDNTCIVTIDAINSYRSYNGEHYQ